MNTQLSKASTTPLEAEKSWFDLLARPAAPLMAAAALVCADHAQAAGNTTADATPKGLRPDNTNDADFIARGSQYALSKQVGYIRITFDDPTSTTGRSAIYGSAALINSNTVITSAHALGGGVWNSNKNPELAFGLSTNFTTSLGDARRINPTNVFFYEGYTEVVDNAFRYTKVDLAILKIKTPITNAPTAKIASSRPEIGSSVWLAGYGRSGTPSGGYVNQDGNIRAGRSIVTGNPEFGESPSYYFNARFRGLLYNDALRGAPGDSGGGVFNERGELVGLMTAAPFSSRGIDTTILDLTNEKIRSKIMELAYRDLKLSIEQTPAGVTVSWPQGAPVKLQSRGLSDGNWWADYPAPPVALDAKWQVIIPESEGTSSRVFRLVEAP